MSRTPTTSTLPLRVEVVAACAVALPLYTVEEAVSRLRGEQWYIPAVDHVDEWVSDLEDRIDATDIEFGESLMGVIDRVAGTVDAILTGVVGPRVGASADE